MSTFHSKTATRTRRLPIYAALLVAAVSLGGCAGGIGPTLTAADLQQDSALAPWQVAGATVAKTHPQARQLDRQQCYGGDGGLVDDCNPLSVRYEGW